MKKNCERLKKIRSHNEVIHRYMRGMICGDMVSLTELAVKQGKGGGVSAYPKIAADFQLWLDPAERLVLIRLVQEMKIK